ncbi:MAG: hypothetical protein BWK76_13970 [Desulfobulbaceae bacterium A2]|nr:MAG: hypothetical protein BWK76_13970 [Desulfobulbaceae bacterium A2]
MEYSPMHLVFYAAADGEAARGYAKRLQTLPCCGAMIVLPGGCRLNTPRCLELRSGDIIILFAADRAELEGLLASSEIFEGFRVVCVLPDLAPETLHLAGSFNPRFITTVESSLTDLSAVLHKMQLSGRSPPCMSGTSTGEPTCR